MKFHHLYAGIYTLWTLWPLFIDGVQLPQGYSHFEQAVYLLFTIQFNFYLHPTCLLIHNESGLLWHNKRNLKSKWHMACDFFFILKYLCNPLLYIPSVCSNRICFKVQKKVNSNLRRIWIILINLCHFKYQTELFSYVSNLDGP